MDAATASLAGTLREAAASGTALCIRGGGTKDFYGNLPSGMPLETGTLRGIVAYEPSELYVTARAGTPLAEVESALAAQGQMLAFEPPHFGAAATIGGCVAAGLAGPRRASQGTAFGSVRDFVLGARLLDGRGRLLTFGGTVMKNVAGYDVARALAGSLGILGVITEVTLKVLPRPLDEVTLRLEMGEPQALEALNAWGGQPWPVSASAWHDGVLHLRLSGAPAAVTAACRGIGGEQTEGGAFWESVREQHHLFFDGDAPLWRVSVPSTAPPLDLGDEQLVEWGGALRWLRTRRPTAELRARAAGLGGHATLFRGGDRSQGVFTPLPSALLDIHRRLKAEFDPAGILNPGRLVPSL
jgi:glycolate oxidase FAD binding subunit